jgi:hypothetical protein
MKIGASEFKFQIFENMHVKSSNLSEIQLVLAKIELGYVIVRFVVDATGVCHISATVAQSGEVVSRRILDGTIKMGEEELGRAIEKMARC